MSISNLVGTVKGKSAIQIFKQFPYLKNKPYWGNHFWAKGYCVDTVGVDAEMIRNYVKYQVNLEKDLEPEYIVILNFGDNLLVFLRGLALTPLWCTKTRF